MLEIIAKQVGAQFSLAEKTIEQPQLSITHSSLMAVVSHTDTVFLPVRTTGPKASCCSSNFHPKSHLSARRVNHDPTPVRADKGPGSLDNGEKNKLYRT